jgi:hypothetical protein
MKPEVGGISEENDLKEKQALIFFYGGFVDSNTIWTYR